MTPIAILLVLVSAVLHATWNMIAKKSGASLAFYAVLGTVGVTWSCFVQFFSPLRLFGLPPAFHAWLAGMVASELLYATGLRLSYRALDMSTAYPMMRSLPLPLLAVITAVFSFGKPVGALGAVGMAMVFVGCLLTPLRRFSDFQFSRYLDHSFLYIVVVALGTTGYTLCDSQAQAVMRAVAPDMARPLVSLTYYSFRVMTLTTTLWVVVLCGRESRAEAAALRRHGLWMPLVAGCCSSLTYVLVLISMNFATNVSYVQAFRQVGLIFGLLESFFILHERCTLPKVVGVALILAGLAVSVA